ncbi:MAG: sensor histidine kinase, partial [Opitutales bacterium]
VHLMDQAIQRMVDIIRHLSSIATHEKHELKEIGLAELISGTVERFRSETKATAPIEVLLNTPDGFRIKANLEIMEGVLIRLLTNAVEAYDRHTPAAERRIEIVADLSGSDIIILVLDNGSGIDSRLEDTIFEPFITTKTSVGRGLGLSIARHTLRSFKGDLEVRNRPEGGAVARVRYPLDPSYVETSDTGLPISTAATLGGAE